MNDTDLMINAVREAFNERARSAPYGYLTRTAQSIGINVGTLGKFRKGTYQGRNDVIAQELAALLTIPEIKEGNGDR